MAKPSSIRIAIAAITAALSVALLPVHAATRNGDAAHPFTQTPVFPSAETQAFPYILVGKLSFKDVTGATSFCTASIIDARVIVTAGHCVWDDLRKRYFTDFVFMPAVSPAKPNGVTQFKPPADPRAIQVTPECRLNCGTLALNDVGMLVMQDNGPAGRAQRLNDVVGGGQHFTFDVAPPAPPLNVVVLGYTRFLDGGNRMQQVMAQSFVGGGPAARFVSAEFDLNPPAHGDSAFSGASGAPWIRDFGVPAVGQVQTATTNHLAGITGYIGYYDLSSTTMAASALTMYRNLCDLAVGNCYVRP